MCRRLSWILVVLAVSTPFAAPQNQVCIPDSTATSTTTSGWPFGPLSPGLTIVQRIPASYLAQTGGIVHDVGFTGQGNGTWSASQIQIVLGHIPSPLPVPFIFPTFTPAGAITAAGSFINTTTAYNSGSQGPFTATIYMNHFSPLGLNTNFVWDGVHDVGLLLTMQGTNWQGGSSNAYGYLTTGPPQVTTWVFDPSTYQAAQSTSTAPVGFKICLNAVPPVFGQPNSSAATLMVNGAGSGTFPGPFLVDIQANGSLTFSWSGPPNMPFVLFAGPQHTANSNFGAVGIADIGTPPAFADLVVLLGGSPSPLFNLNPGGSAQQTFTLPTIPQGPAMNIQGAVFQPAGPPNVVLTAAFYLSVP